MDTWALGFRSWLSCRNVAVQDSFLGARLILKSNNGPVSGSVRVMARADSSKEEAGFPKIFESFGARGIGAGEVSLKTDEGKASLFPSETSSKSPRALDVAEMDPGLDMATFDIDKDYMGTGAWPGGEVRYKEYAEVQRREALARKEKTRAEKLMGRVAKVRQRVASGPLPTALPMLLPGMNAMVINPKNQYEGYTGIVQRVTDGNVGILFEGGCWDKMVTFQLDEVKRVPKGAPGENPKSATLEERVEKLKAMEARREAREAAAAPAAEKKEEAAAE
eukprot:jgi/Mesvir1/21585/Mv04023-RA.3